MLEEVRITALGVIDDAVLELSPGFTVVTGETGAGKTMVVTGLGLLFGGRADPARVRPGADRATVEGRLRVDPGGHVAQQVADAGGELVAVHGQADQQQLLKPGRQRAALDRYAGDKLSAVLADYQRVFHRHRDVRAELADLTARARERAEQ